jgi:hypothetical protein
MGSKKQAGPATCWWTADPGDMEPLLLFARSGAELKK